jgi:hypothetical protein
MIIARQAHFTSIQVANALAQNIGALTERENAACPACPHHGT